MIRKYAPSPGPGWEESFEIRKAALEAASRTNSGRGCTSEQIINLAKVLEMYLKGDM